MDGRTDRCKYMGEIRSVAYYDGRKKVCILKWATVMKKQ